MKIVLGILIVTLTTLVGYMLSQKYTDRVKYYKDFIEFNDNLISGITFSSKTIIELINKENKSFFNNKLKEYFLKENINETGNFLDKSEKEYLNNYLNQIGDKNKQMQLEYVKQIESEIKVKYEISKKEQKKYKSLYIKLGLLIGVMIFVLLI